MIAVFLWTGGPVFAVTAFVLLRGFTDEAGRTAYAPALGLALLLAVLTGLAATGGWALITAT